ncbi:acetoacetate--CoA ligase [Actinobacteria bacterium YIM 96077]|uniref:Acetoacetate--CoA ligase n=1 Tax=Phytoactinopolyspora halophila TaxID=1981511 RepID=A0A329R2P6_9ACTN|nr:acetoacetate--CoA ligase [Phytoactinopolyspora halophila]AYY11916.1 acetoacetate--CoA ligase [Actinobacteria bacterium YIM 96077]RAW18850.1 acetoacetate--CoA ligase [Phytoactinopolyspora halophila]
MAEPEVVWTPDPHVAGASQLARFRTWLRSRGVVDADDYDTLWRWSVDDPASFWASLAQYYDVAFHEQPSTALADSRMPGARWFPGATLNYAEHALRPGEGKSDNDLAVIFRREDGLEHGLTYGELRTQVAGARSALRDLGVGRGDRVVALVPNSPETLIAFLATASLGAIWSSCSPDFGLRAVVDRFSQLEPAVLITIDGYVYNGRAYDISGTVAQLQAELPTLRTTVVVPYLAGSSLPGSPTSVSDGADIEWNDLLRRGHGAALEFEPVSFDHPLWVLYSSGTTGLPKGIVHGHGGITLEHLKAMGLHFDAGPGDRFFWFTTTGWMMWNFLVSGLLVGATVVLYDGSPAHPGMHALWQFAADEDITVFGTSAPFIQACLKDDLQLSQHDLSALRIVGSTGAPLSADGFRWLTQNLGPSVQIASFSGGTDLCTGFIGPAPDVPVWLGELSRPALGAAVAAFDENGEPVVDDVGELVLTQPMPSMPVSFWNDPDGSRLREAYFDVYPGVWRHGDWVTVTHRGSAIIHGRSDSTLNRGGIRMGTAEFYRVVESHPGVLDSLVIDTSGTAGEDGELWCFLVLADAATLEEVEAELRTELRRQLSPRHVPDRFVAVSDVPRTLNGKKCEVPVKKILTGRDPERAVSRDALQNPGALDSFIALGSA